MAKPREQFEIWFEEARRLVAGQPTPPLIDTRRIDMEDTLADAWTTNSPWWEFLDKELHYDFEDKVQRFVVLNFYCRSVELLKKELKNEKRKQHFEKKVYGGVIDGENITQEVVDDVRESFRTHVGLRSPEMCSTGDDVSWEIVNACLAEMWERAEVLYRKLRHARGLSEREINILLARYHGLRGKVWGGSVWQPGSTEAEDLFRGITIFRGKAAFGEEEVAIKVAECLESAELVERLGAIDRGLLACALAARQCRAAQGAEEFNTLLTEPLFASHADIICVHLATALEDAEKFDTAIEVVRGMKQALGKDPKVWEAQLELKRGNYREAAILFAEVHHFKEDSINTMLAALASASTPLEQLEKLLDERRPDEKAVVQELITSYWPAFGDLCPSTRQRWITASTLLFLPDLAQRIIDSSETIVFLTTKAVELELRSKVFEPFRDRAKPGSDLNSLARTADNQGDILGGYLLGRKRVTLGQMVRILNDARGAYDGLYAELRRWVQKNTPGAFSIPAGVSDANAHAKHEANAPPIDHVREIYHACREALIRLTKRVGS